VTGRIITAAAVYGYTLLESPYSFETASNFAGLFFFFFSFKMVCLMISTFSIVEPLFSYPVSLVKFVIEGRGVYSWKLVAARMADLCYSVIILPSCSLCCEAILVLR
jgi:hypothetical protein